MKPFSRHDLIYSDSTWNHVVTRIRRGSNRQLYLLLIITVLLAIFILLYRYLQASSRLTIIVPPSIHNISKVRVQVFMESQCPDTGSFIDEQLWPTWSKMKDYIDLELIPYGKAEHKAVADDFEIFCQHQAKECLVNQFMACAIERLQVVDIYFAYIKCAMEKSLDEALQECTGDPNFREDIRACAEGPEGRRLHAKMGDRTPKLNFVPWILINGKRSKRALRSFKKAVCQHFKENIPEQCQVDIIPPVIPES